MKIPGGCHCRNITFALDWPDASVHIPVRLCACAFCVKHGGRWTAHRNARLVAELGDPALVTRYRFGTKTADFYVCVRCGVVPFVTSAIDEVLYAVVNVNTFQGVDRTLLVESSANFDGEGEGERLSRRQRNWIADVRILGA